MRIRVLQTSGLALALSVTLLSGFNQSAQAANCDQLGPGWSFYGDFQVVLEGSYGREGNFGPSNVSRTTPFHHFLQKYPNASNIYIVYLYREIFTSRMYSQCYSPQAGHNQIYAKDITQYAGADINSSNAEGTDINLNSIPPYEDYVNHTHPELERFAYKITGPSPQVIANTSAFSYIEPPVPDQAPIIKTYTDTPPYYIFLTDEPDLKAAEKALNDKASTEQPQKDGQPKANPQKQAGDPVDLFSGSFQIQNIDLAVPGIIQPQVARWYQSAFGAKDGPFGKGTSLMPYNALLKVKTDGNGQVIKAAGTEITYSSGDHTEVTLKDIAGDLTFTAPDKTGFADSKITVQTDSQGKMTGAKLLKANGDQFVFDADGYLSQIQDRNQNTVSMIRDSAHLITRIEDPSTHKGINLVYDGNQHVTQVTGLAGQTIHYTYDVQGRLISITDPAGHSVSFTYDANGQILTSTDARGNQVAQNTYNADGRVTDQVMADGSTMHLEYPDATTRKITDGNGHVREHHFESHGLFTGIKTPLNQTYSTTYSPALFDTSGGARTITNTDPQGRTVVTELNNRNQPVRITDQAGRVTEMTYEPTFNLLSTIKDPLGRITRFTYDANGNVTQAQDPDGNTSTFTYNAQGQVLSATDALGQKAQYAYDPNHDLTQVTDPLGNKTTYTYDTLSRLTKVTDAKGNSTQYSYDNLNRVTQITDALGKITRFAYDENGNVVSVTDPKSHTSTASYDPMNRLVSTTNAKGETANLSYDADGNVVSSTDPKGQTTQYSYDALEQVSDVNYSDGTHYHYTYDNLNRMTDLSDGTQQWHFAYDILDRLISENTPQGSLNYTYDTVSRLTGFTSPNTNYAPVQYAYDNLDRITGITQNGKTYGYTYDSVGRRTSLIRPNGIQTVYEYDAASRLSTLTHSKGTTAIERHTYAYDPNGNITQYVRGKGTAQPVVSKPCGPRGKGTIKQVLGYVEDKAETLTRTYTYDPLNRLTSVKGLGMVESASQFKNAGQKLAASVLMNLARQSKNPQAQETLLKQAEQLGAVLPESATWTFDANGNIASKTLRLPGGTQQVRTFTYDEADRLTQLVKAGGPNAGTIHLAYDANGNLISDSTGRQFTWNAQDQLTKVQFPSLSALMGYDPLGRRTTLSKGASNKTFFYLGQSLLSDGSSRFLQGASIDQPLQLDTNLGSQSYLQDHLGSTSQLIDSLNGNSKTRYDYKSYGKLEGDGNNPQASNPFTYTGREDDGTGLLYYRARYYDSELEVFISQDPLDDAQRYVSGNPLSYVDPLGLDAVFLQYAGFNVTVPREYRIEIPLPPPGSKFKIPNHLPLGHAAVITIDTSTGKTQYYEYGRYDAKQFGIVRRQPIPDVLLGSDGKPTQDSLKKIYDFVSSHYGQGKPVNSTYFTDANAAKINSFANQRMNDKNRAPYGPTNNCYTFGAEAIQHGY